MTTLLQRKMTLAFDALDSDRDGILNRADFEAIADRYAQLRGWSPGDAEYKRHHGFMVGWWEELRCIADANGDGRVTPAEASTFLEGADPTEIAAAGEIIFDVLDADYDGQISLPEYGNFLRAMGLDDTAAEESFSRLDSNGDGTISRTEFGTLYADFYLGDDPDAPGNWLYGCNPT